MIAHRRQDRLNHKEEKIAMKKLMTLMLGLALVTGTVAVSFAQDTKSDDTSKKKSKGKKKGDDTSKGSHHSN